LVRAAPVDGPIGLASDAAFLLGESLGARTATVGAESVGARRNQLALGSAASIVTENGEVLVAVRSAQPPTDVAALRTMTSAMSLEAPTSAIEVVPSGST